MPTYKATRNSDGSISFTFSISKYQTVEGMAASASGLQLYDCTRRNSSVESHTPDTCTVTLSKMYDLVRVNLSTFKVFKSTKEFSWTDMGRVSLDVPDGYYKIDTFSGERIPYGRDYLPVYFTQE